MGKRLRVCVNGVCLNVVVFSYLINWNFVLVRVMRAVVSAHVVTIFSIFVFVAAAVDVAFLFFSTLFDTPLNWLLIFLCCVSVCKHTCRRHRTPFILTTSYIELKVIEGDWIKCNIYTPQMTFKIQFCLWFFQLHTNLQNKVSATHNVVCALCVCSSANQCFSRFFSIIVINFR